MRKKVYQIALECIEFLEQKGIQEISLQNEILERALFINHDEEELSLNSENISKNESDFPLKLVTELNARYRLLAGYFFYMQNDKKKKTFTRKQVEDFLVSKGCAEQDYGPRLSELLAENMLTIAGSLKNKKNAAKRYQITPTGEVFVNKLIQSQ